MAKGRADFYLEGDYNAACSMCGRKRKASTMVKNWQGYWRCPEHNEPRQSQDFVRAVADTTAPPWTQLEEDIDLQVCTYNGISAIPGLALPGCMIPGRAQFDLWQGPWTGGPVLLSEGNPDINQELTTEDGQPILLEGSEPS
jgi:hypothetical protein